MQLVNTGHCVPRDTILSDDISQIYQKCYAAIFLVCVVIVLVLYVLIYRSVLRRRAIRQRQKSRTLSLVMQTQLSPISVVAAEPEVGCGKRELAVSGCTKFLTLPTADASPTAAVQHELRRLNSGCNVTIAATATAAATSTNTTTTTVAPCRMPRNSIVSVDLVANLKTAAMLFVVTVVFIVTFLPALLMSLQLVSHNLILFYLYFVNNVANPVIYSFMNRNFRDNLRRLFQRRK